MLVVVNRTDGILEFSLSGGAIIAAELLLPRHLVLVRVLQVEPVDIACVRIDCRRDRVFEFK